MLVFRLPSHGLQMAGLYLRQASGDMMNTIKDGKSRQTVHEAKKLRGRNAMNYDQNGTHTGNPEGRSCFSETAGEAGRYSGSGLSGKRTRKRRLLSALLACAVCFAAGVGASFLIPKHTADTGAAETLRTEAAETEDASSGGMEQSRTDSSGSSADNHEANGIRLSAQLRAASGDTKSASEIYAENVHSVVGITTEGTTTNIFGQVSASASTGTGFIISEDGYILTNHHVIENGSTYTVTLYDGTVYEGTRIGADTENDIAVLKINASGLRAVTLGDADSIAVGEDVVIIGNPLGELTYTMTRGIISALGREIDTGDGPIEMFQIDAAVNSGNSGGPAFNAYGQVIGIVTAKYAASSVEGLGFCVPVNQAAESADDLIRYGYIRGRATLGISYTDASEAYQYYLRLLGTRVKDQLSKTGIYITAVDASSAAEKAGISKGDFITAVDDTAVQSAEDYRALMKTKKPGDTVTVTVFRAGEELLMQIILQEEVPD